jgi:alkyldihydroxyacetonephosphate synthase
MDPLSSISTARPTATFEAGVAQPTLEAQLAPHGLTLGHFPQSFELSTLGGWIATRSSGQQSYHYGRIEDHFLGGHMESFLGPLDLPALPASAAGPDVRHIILGSEGRIGVITRATLRVHPLPETEGFYGVFFRDWASGAEAVREITQARAPVAMLRLSDAMETETTLALSGKERLVRWADRGLRLLRYSGSRSLLIYGVTGEARLARLARRIIEEPPDATAVCPPAP